MIISKETSGSNYEVWTTTTHAWYWTASPLIYTLLRSICFTWIILNKPQISVQSCSFARQVQQVNTIGRHPATPISSGKVSMLHTLNFRWIISSALLANYSNPISWDQCFSQSKIQKGQLSTTFFILLDPIPTLPPGVVKFPLAVTPSNLCHSSCNDSKAPWVDSNGENIDIPQKHRDRKKNLWFWGSWGSLAPHLVGSTSSRAS